MYIAQELRKNSIAEYLLYMWQIEDLIRAYGCSLTNIRREYIGRFDYSEDQKEELADWFGNLIKMMNEEGLSSSLSSCSSSGVRLKPYQLKRPVNCGVTISCM